MKYLVISHKGFRGSYQAFHRFRQIVCAAAGGSFPPHQDKERHPNDKLMYTNAQFHKDTHPGLWEFLTHPDDRGEISPEMCEKVAKDLKELIPEVVQICAKLHDPKLGSAFITAFGNFIMACEWASADGKPLKFQEMYTREG